MKNCVNIIHIPMATSRCCSDIFNQHIKQQCRMLAQVNWRIAKLLMCIDPYCNGAGMVVYISYWTVARALSRSRHAAAAENLSRRRRRLWRIGAPSPPPPPTFWAGCRSGAAPVVNWSSTEASILEFGRVQALQKWWMMMLMQQRRRMAGCDGAQPSLDKPLSQY